MLSQTSCRSIKEEYPPCIVLLDFKRDYATSSMKVPDDLIFCNTFQHLSLYSTHFTQNLDKLYTRIFRKNHSIYWWKRHEYPCSSFRIHWEQTDRQTRRRTLFYNMYRLFSPNCRDKWPQARNPGHQILLVGKRRRSPHDGRKTPPHYHNDFILFKRLCCRAQNCSYISTIPENYLIIYLFTILH